MNKLSSYLQSSLSEPNGTGSSTRLFSFLLVNAWIIFGFILIFKSPIHISEYLSFTFSLIVALSIGKAVEKINTKGSVAQAIPEAPESIKE